MQFNHPLFHQESISQLSPMAKGRIEKVLDKLWRFDGVVRSMGEQLKMEFESGLIKAKYATNNMWKWNRRKFNNMNGEEQREYEAGLIKGRTYHIDYGGGSCREIPKVIYDALNLLDTTKHEALNEE